MNNFYELLSKKGIKDFDSAQDFVYKKPIKNIYDLCEESVDSIRSNKLPCKTYTLYDFSANHALSGDFSSCYMNDCRAKRANNLSIFAALYASSVIIPNFFEGFHKSLKFNSKFDEYSFREKVFGNINVYLIFKPLIESNIVYVNPGVINVCKNCQMELVKEEKDLESKIEIFKKELEVLMSKELKFKLDEKGFLIISGSEKYLDHGASVVFFPVFPKKLEKYKDRKNYSFSPMEAKTNHLAKPLIDQWFSDLITQKWSPLTRKLTYLTNREIDRDIICLINKKENNKSLFLLDDQLAHSLPFFDNINIRKAIELRKSEQDSFEAYQNAIKKALYVAKLEKNPKAIKKIFEDIALPEVSKINRIIKNNKKDIVERAFGKSLYNLGIISIGLIGNLFTQWSLGAFIGAFGGLQTLKDIVGDAIEYYKTPIDVKNNEYYFLWKLKNNQNLARS